VSYLSSRALGFTPDEEREVVLAARSEVAEEKKVDEILEILRRQDQLRTITTIAAVGGALFTLAKLGEFVAVLRGRRKELSL
jgi:hypothetical protein